MFNNILKGIIENETVEVYEKTSTIKPGGGEKLEWKFKAKIVCNIQANHKYGEALQTSPAGDTVTAVYNLYTKSYLVEGQRIKRDDNIIYEIRNVEHNGRGTILDHFKAYLTRVDNQ